MKTLAIVCLVVSALAMALGGVTARAVAEVRPIPPPTSSLTGRVIDAESREPVGWATVVLVELSRGERSHRDGTFHFVGIPAGRYTLRVSFIGYETVEMPVDVASGDSVDVNIELHVTSLTTRTIVVTAARDASAASFNPDLVITGAQLQQRLGRTLAESIGGEAGVTQRSMGPATARPVVRGLGGDRLQLLEDGSSTGDLSATSSDHAVAIDPLNAERIEVLRGPASMIYTSNALGGVVNLIRNRIARTHPDRAHGIATIQGESVNAGATGGVSASIPLGPLALQVDGTARRADDIATPVGRLDNTDQSSINGSVGLSYVVPWGLAGAAAGTLTSEYGIPGGFAGAHEEGVRVSMQRQFAEGALELLPERSFVRRIELHGSWSRYRHEEIESGGVIGTEYGLLSGEVAALAHHDTLGSLARGTLGIRYDGRNLVANGVSIPPSTEHAFAAMVYEEAPLGPLTARGALRFDHHIVEPEQSRQASIGSIDTRTFTGVSGSLALAHEVVSGLQLAVTAMRTLRTPTIDELFSEGPHLASYSYEVGNPELDVETGMGIEARAQYTGDRGQASLAIFRNDIDGYIYPRNTGDTNLRLRLPIYRQTGSHVVMKGIEISTELEIVERLVATASMSAVVGDLVEEERPLPTIPPLSGRLGLRYTGSTVTVGASFRGAADQKRVGEHEEPTDGYLVADAFAQVQYLWGPMLHAVVLSVDNIADTQYRSHLSRTKSIMPEPGRNVRLLYRVYF